MGQVKKLWMEMQERCDWPSDELRGKYVCTQHFEDKYLRALVEEKGHHGTCSYCGRKGIVSDMYDIGEQIAWRVGLYFIDPSNADLQLAKYYYDDYGEIIPGFQRVGDFVLPTENTVYESTQEMMFDLGLFTDDDELNEDIADIFSTDTWVSKDIYEEDQNIRLSNQWDRFVNTVTHQRRFTFLATPEFLKTANDEYSDDILTRLREIIVEQGLCVDLPAGTTAYRARKVDNPDAEYLFKDITAPPEKCAFPNRMSPAGVSMFYASFDKDTAMDECVGDETKTIIVGTFKTNRNLRIIDLSRIPENSFWMKGWQENQFLHKFNTEITKRIDPNDKKHLQYIPTQIFTEYLRYMFKDGKGSSVDGLIYGSSKTKDKNLVLFCNQNASSRYVEKDVIIEVFESKSVWEKRKYD